jgi:transcriptional regulator with XRE-family HTH domain
MLRDVTTTAIDLPGIAATVKARRAANGLRQHQLAAAAAVSLRTIQGIEAGDRAAHESTYGRIAQALDLTLEQLLGGEA